MHVHHTQQLRIRRTYRAKVSRLYNVDYESPFSIIALTPESPIRRAKSRRRPSLHETAQIAFNCRTAKCDNLRTTKVPSATAIPVILERVIYSSLKPPACLRSRRLLSPLSLQRKALLANRQRLFHCDTRLAQTFEANTIQLVMHSEKLINFEPLKNHITQRLQQLLRSISLAG